MFADIVDSTRLIADLNAEQASDVLRPVIAAIAEAVRRFGGTVDRSLGDGLKASFGAPSALEGHAVLACKAALAIQQSIAALPRTASVRIGLHSGEVVTGELDTGSAIEPDTTGVTVHLASRMEELAAPGEILLTGECCRLVRPWFEIGTVGPRNIRGFRKPVQTFRLLSERPVFTSRQFQSDALSPLLGRKAELALLQRSLFPVGRGEACAIGISAPAGIGKSRLCYEFAEICRRRGIGVLEARASVYGYAAPLQAVLELVRTFLGVSAVDEPVTVRRKIADRLAGIDDFSEADLEFLGGFLSAADGKKSRLHDPLDAQSHLRTFISRIIASVGRVPSIIIIEDLHWLDPASESVLEVLVDAIVGTRILLLMNFRPSYRAEWMKRAHYEALALSELAASDMRQLVDNLMGEGADLAAISAQVADRSGGNPFFAEELVQALSEDGILVGMRGRYRRGTKGVSGQSLPPTLEAVIGARIDRMPETDRILLQISSTIGREFPIEILRKVAEMPDGQIDAGLGRLANAGIIQARETMSGSGFAFRHPLIQEVAYARQLQSRRTALHATVAQAIAQCEWGHLDEFAGLLAHHHEAAGQAEEAARQLYRSATWIGRTDAEEAYRQWKKTHRLLDSNAQSADGEKMRALASVAVLRFGYKVGISEEDARPYSEEALRYARKFPGTEEGQQVLVQYGRFQAATGSADAYAALTEEALVNATGNAGRIATHQGCLAQAHWMSGFLSKAEDASNAALETLARRRMQGITTIVGLDAPPLAGFDVEVWVKCNKARILVWLCRFDQATALLDEVFQAKGTPRETSVEQSIAHLACVEMARYRNDAAGALLHAEQIERYSERAEIAYLRVQAILAAALAKAVTGDFASSARGLRAGLDLIAKSKAAHDLEPLMLAELSYAQYRSGKVHEAEATARSAITIAQHRNRRTAECLATIVHGAAIVPGDSTEATYKTREAFARAEELICLTGAELLAPIMKDLRAASAMFVN